MLLQQNCILEAFNRLEEPGMKNFKKVLVTGAAGGIVTEICRELAEKGVSLVACDISDAGLAELAKKLEGLTIIDTICHQHFLR